VGYTSPHTGLVRVLINVAGEKNWPMLVLKAAFFFALSISLFPL